jgi:hypothetical protein
MLDCLHVFFAIDSCSTHANISSQVNCNFLNFKTKVDKSNLKFNNNGIYSILEQLITKHI